MPSASPVIRITEPPGGWKSATCYLWDHRKELADLVDVWEAANRDDLFSVTSLKHYPYVANSDFHKPKHLYSWKTLVRSAKTWPAVKTALKANIDIAITFLQSPAQCPMSTSSSSIPCRGRHGEGVAAERVRAATHALDRLGVPAEIRLTERAGHAHEIAVEAAASGVELVIAWGGDGTINEVGRALVQTSVGRDWQGATWSRAHAGARHHPRRIRQRPRP